MRNQPFSLLVSVGISLRPWGDGVLDPEIPLSFGIRGWVEWRLDIIIL